MRALTSQEEKKVLLGILIYFDKLCRKHGLNYTLHSGTLLGAARHKGFIPWDDDVDVAMPLPDYLRFLQLDELHDNKGRYILHEARFEQLNHENYHYPYAKLEDRTTFVKYSNTFDKIGVFIDIFPLTGYPNDQEQLVRLASEMQKLRWKVFVGVTKYKNPFKKIISSIISKRYKYYRDRMIAEAFSVNFTKAEYIGNIFWASENDSKKMPSYYLKSYIQLEFEGKKLKVVSNYKKVLDILYGDWESIPPKEKQVTHSMKTFKK